MPSPRSSLTHGSGQSVSDGLLRVEEGSLYPALHRLQKLRFLKGEWKVTGNGRRARYYTLTPSGRRRLAEAEANWSALAKGIGKVLGFA